MPPRPPVFTNITSISTTSMILWYQPPADSITGYKIFWSYVGPCSGLGTPSNGQQSLNGSSRNLTLSDLRPNSHYLVTLVAVDNDVESASSQAIVNTTIEGSYRHEH